MIKKLATLTIVGLLASVSHAATITSQLNCPIVGGTACTSTTASYGQITFTDATGGVNIGVALTSGTTVQDIFFNYTTSSTSTPITATINGGSFSNSAAVVTNSPNSLSLNGSGNYPGLFDVSITGNNGTTTQAGSNFTISLTTSLAATTIANSLDTNGLLDFAVHLQNCGPNSGTCLPGQTGSNSLVVGERQTTTPNNPTPEPSSLLLLGTGIASAAGILRRRLIARA